MKNTLHLVASLALLTAVSVVHSEEKAAVVDVSGTWNLEVVTDQGTGNPTFTFVQEGESLTGRYNGFFGEAPVTGTIKGDAITFSIKADIEAQPVTVTYSGTVSGDSMKGTIQFGDMGGATFTGKRAPK